MKRIMFFLVVIVAVISLRGLFPSTDVERMLPVQLLSVSRDEELCYVFTDTGEMGSGKNLSDAFTSLRDTASGNLFLETADYLLLEVDCIGLLGDTHNIIRPGTRLCLIEGNPNLENALTFLRTHDPKITLAQWRAGATGLPVLLVREGRMKLLENTHQ